MMKIGDHRGERIAQREGVVKQNFQAMDWQLSTNRLSLLREAVAVDYGLTRSYKVCAQFINICCSASVGWRRPTPFNVNATFI